MMLRSMVIAGFFLLALWLVQLGLALRVWRSVPTLATIPQAQRASWPKLSMVVPARNEAAHVEAALGSKLGCGYPSLEVVAVDDRSNDGTGEYLDRLAHRERRLRVVHVDTLPEGWLGKLNAMSRGLERATGEWVLFSDADVSVAPGVLERLIGWAESNAVDFVAVFPQMKPAAPWVDAAIASFLRVLTITGRVWKANDDRSHVATGVGAFNLVRRSWLERTRALDLLRMEVADDMGLALLLKQSGARTRFFAGRKEVSLVFMDSLGALARSADKGGHFLGFGLFAPVAFAVVPVLVELVAPAVLLAQGGLAASVGFAVLVAATAMHAVPVAHFAGPPLGVLLWPLGQLVTSALFLRAGYRTWREQGVYWRGTFYPRPALEAGRRLSFRTLRMDLEPRPLRDAEDAERRRAS